VPGEILPSREFYDYEAKYLDEGSKTVIPADLPQATVAQVQRLAIEAFRAIDGAGLARVDFLMDGDAGTIYLNEINTLPGFTNISMYSKMWEASGVGYSALVDRLIQLGIERHKEKQQLKTSAL
jgi:D-alanine-D-alanine ligase